jgi:hypothetical protein
MGRTPRVKQGISMGLSIVLVLTLGPGGVSSLAYQSTEPPAPSGTASNYPGQGVPATADELQSLVAPIALYPDALVAQILSAATFPDQVAVANYWVQQNKSLTGSALMTAVDKQTWDPSVKALTQFPSVLNNMAQNLSWTSELGEDYQLKKNAGGQWYFDVAAGKDEILARRIGGDEITAIGVCAALADAQTQYFSQKHGGAKEYAQKFISDAGEQNGLYWESPQGSPRSPLGPLVAFATEQQNTIKPDAAQPFYGYYFRLLENQGSDAKGGAKSYLANGMMTRGFAYVAYPSKYDDTGIKTFIINQDRVVYEKNIGKDTTDVAKAMTEFNPDKSWTALN